MKHFLILSLIILTCANSCFAKVISNEKIDDLKVQNASKIITGLQKEMSKYTSNGSGPFVAAIYDDNGNLIGLAACSADGDTMWQIGIDVLPEYRRQGIASALTSRLAVEILERDKVPFYCCAWSNIKSARNAIKSGFRPAWAQMTVKPLDIINEMNEIK